MGTQYLKKYFSELVKKKKKVDFNNKMISLNKLESFK